MNANNAHRGRILIFLGRKSFSFIANENDLGNYKNLKAAKRMKYILENRLKRFRMLDQDEFQEMLKTFGQQSADEQPKLSNAMDSIGGMQLASKFRTTVE